MRREGARAPARARRAVLGCLVACIAGVAATPVSASTMGGLEANFAARGSNPVGGAWQVYSRVCHVNVGYRCEVRLEGTASSSTFSAGTGSYRSGSLKIDFSFEMSLVYCATPNVLDYCGYIRGPGTASDGTPVDVHGVVRTTDLRYGDPVYGARVNGQLGFTSADMDPQEELDCVAAQLEDPSYTGDQLCWAAGHALKQIPQ